MRSGGATSFDTNRIYDPFLRGVSNVVRDRVAHNGRDTQLDAKHVESARRLVEAHQEAIARGKEEESPLAEWPPIEREMLVEGIDELHTLVETKGDYLVAPNRTGEGPFCRSLAINTLVDHPLRDTARAIAQADRETAITDRKDSAKEGRELNLRALLRARDVRAKAKKNEPLKERDQRFLALLAEAESKGHLDDRRIRALDLFFLKGGLDVVNAGPVEILGHKLPYLFALALEKKWSELSSEEKTLQLIAVEQQVRACGFDRVYIEYKGDLYVGLHVSGRIDAGKNAVTRGLKIDMPENRRMAEQGTIVDVVDVVNSLGEALTAFPRRVRRFLAGPPKPLATEAEHLLGKEAFAPAGHGSDMVQALTVGGGAVYLSQMLQHMEAGIAVTAALGVIATGAEVVSYYGMVQDLRPVLHAAGIPVQRTNPISR